MTRSSATSRRARLATLFALMLAALALIAAGSAAAAPGAHLFAGGLAAVEAESHDAKAARSGHDWVTGQSPAGSVGSALTATPDNGARIASSIPTTSPEVGYRVVFPSAGTHQLWLRVYGIKNGNTLHAGLNGAATAQNVAAAAGAWRWVKAPIGVPSAGEHVVQLWMREDGLSVDRFVLTADAGYTPSGNGPAATPREADTGPDTTPPTVAGHQPADGATGVAAGADAGVTFSEPMDPATVTASSFTLAPAGGGPAVPATIAASGGNTTFTLDPVADLAPDTHYTATVGTGVRDVAGNAPAAPVSWLFTTAPAAGGATGSGAVTFAGGLAVVEAEDADARVARAGDDWVAGALPAGAVGQALRALPDDGTAATGDVVSTMPELGYRVDFPAAGTYHLWLRAHVPDGAGNSAHTGLNGALAPSYHFLNTYGAWAWLGKAFSGARATVVVPSAGVHTVQVWMREDGFALDRLLLTADPGYTPTGTGPSATPRDTAPDTTAPALTGHQPAPGATGVPVGTGVVATFSEAMDPATLTGATVALAPSAGGPPVAATVTPSAGNTTVTLQPSAALAAETAYTVTISDGVRDTAGNAFAGASWSFTTAAPPPPDTTPPSLTGRQPASGATGAATGANVVATFSEAMDAATVAMTLEPGAGGPAVSATVTPSAGNTTFTLDPSAPLATGASYTARVAATAADLAGNAIGAEQAWSFTTSTSTNLVAVDIAAQAGLRDTTGTQGENCVFDFDRDGIRDVFLSTHGTGWRLMRGRADGTFTEVERFPGTDRHGCAIGDFGGLTASGAYTGPDGRPDIYATIGACQGTCTTPFPNELWLQRPDGDYLPPGQDQLEGTVPSGNKANAGSAAAKAFGVADDRGRGREPLGFDIDGGGLMDLFVGNEESELYFSANRLFTNDGDGDMSALASSAVVQEVGSEASTAADIDGDGRMDLANVGSSRLYVFHNTGGGFQDVTSAWGIPTGGGPKDIEFADLNGDGRLDAIIANHTSLKVRLNRDGRFPTEDYSRSISQGRDLAIGDADGDGDLDVYVVLGQNEDYDDLLLRNGGRALSTGKWDLTTIAIPQADAGEGDTAQAIPDWAGTNRAAFLVNNGKWDGRGARQLIVMVPS